MAAFRPRRIHDVSLPIAEQMLVWPTDPAVEIRPAKRIAAGDASNVSELRLGSHTGTHVDPPLHFIDGAPAVDALPPDALVGEAVVADLGDARGAVGTADLDALDIPAGVERLLLKSPNSELWRGARTTFPGEYTCLSPQAARWVVDRGIRLIGVDFLSIEAQHAEGHPVHRTLLESAVVIVEGLNLAAVAPGRYTLVCLPLRIVGGDGAPARVLLLE